MNNNRIVDQLKNSEGKKIKIYLKNGLNFTTSDLIVLNSNEISFHDIKNDKITCSINLVQMVTELANEY